MGPLQLSSGLVWKHVNIVKSETGDIWTLEHSLQTPVTTINSMSRIHQVSGIFIDSLGHKTNQVKLFKYLYFFSK